MKGKSDLRNDCRGFTIIEVIVTCLIITVLGTISFAGFSVWLPNYELKRAVRELYSSMQQAKMTAIKQQSSCTIKYFQGPDRYEVTGVTKMVTFSEEYSRGVRFAGPSGFATPSPPYDSSTITFNSRGVSTGGEVLAYLSNDNGTAYYRVGPRSTGVIRLQKWVSGAWQD